jgi:hypothetical protein
MGEKKSLVLFTGDKVFPLSKNPMKVYMGQHPKGSKE